MEIVQLPNEKQQLMAGIFYRLVIPNERYKYVRPFQIAVIMVNMVTLSVATFYQRESLNYTWPILLLLSILIILNEKKLRRYSFFRKINFTETGFLWAITGWVFLSHIWIAFAVAAVALLKGLVTRTFEFIFWETAIQLQFFPKKTINWQQLQNVVLKDGLLTIDFKNNKIIQSEILPAESNFINEAEFNEFCRTQLAAKS